jgi:hypothetical protein
MTEYNHVVTPRCWAAVVGNITTHLWQTRDRYRRCLSNRTSGVQRVITDTSVVATALGYTLVETLGEGIKMMANGFLNKGGTLFENGVMSQ